MGKKNATLDRTYGMEGSKLMKLFEDSLKDMYWAEKAMVKALSKMARKASSDELTGAIESHLTETEEQVERVEKVFRMIGKKATGKKCDAMDGLIKEAEGIMEEAEEGAMRDAVIIAAAQKVEHYEISSYGTLNTYAKTLGMDDVSALLETILAEEKKADETLTEIAVTTIHLRAASEKV